MKKMLTTIIEIPIRSRSPPQVRLIRSKSDQEGYPSIYCNLDKHAIIVCLRSPKIAVLKDPHAHLMDRFRSTLASD